MGRIAEQLWWEDTRHLQRGRPDAYVLVEDEFCLIEIKGASAFEAPPWRGHGLEAAQAERYMKAYRDKRVRTRLVIYDPEGYRYSAWLDELEHGPAVPCADSGRLTGFGANAITTPGTTKRPRRIYPLANFRCEERPEIATRLQPVSQQATNGEWSPDTHDDLPPLEWSPSEAA